MSQYFFDDPPLSNIELPPAKLPGVSQLYYQHVQNAKDPTRDAKLASARKKLITAIVDGNALQVGISLRDLSELGVGATDDSLLGPGNNAPLHLACEAGFANVVAVLIDAGAIVNLVNRAGNTPAHIAARENRIDCVRLLGSPQALARFSALDANGRTPAEVADRFGHHACAAVIKELTYDDETIHMLRREHKELMRQRGMARRKEILFGRSLTTLEGGHEFDFPDAALLNAAAKKRVLAGLRASVNVQYQLEHGIRGVMRRAKEEAEKAAKEAREREAQVQKHHVEALNCAERGALFHDAGGSSSPDKQEEEEVSACPGKEGTRNSRSPEVEETESTVTDASLVIADGKGTSVEGRPQMRGARGPPAAASHQQLSLAVPPQSEERAEQRQTRSGKEAEPVRSTIWLSIVSASGILAADKGGTSDAYATAELVDVESGATPTMSSKFTKEQVKALSGCRVRTSTVKKTVNPVWDFAAMGAKGKLGENEVEWRLAVDNQDTKKGATQAAIGEGATGHAERAASEGSTGVDLRRVSLKVSVFDADLMSSELLGVAFVPLAPLLASEGALAGRGGGAIEASHRLIKGGKMRREASGSVTVRLRVVAAVQDFDPSFDATAAFITAREAAGGEAAANGETPLGNGIERKEREGGAESGLASTIWLSLKSAAGLQAADKGGTSDPYATAELVDVETGKILDAKFKTKSKTMKQTLDPVWDEKEVQWKGVLAPPPSSIGDSKEKGQLLDRAALQVTVFDADLLSSTMLGRASVTLFDLLRSDSSGGGGKEQEDADGDAPVARAFREPVKVCVPLKFVPTKMKDLLGGGCEDLGGVLGSVTLSVRVGGAAATEALERATTAMAARKAAAAAQKAAEWEAALARAKAAMAAEAQELKVAAEVEASRRWDDFEDDSEDEAEFFIPGRVSSSRWIDLSRGRPPDLGYSSCR